MAARKRRLRDLLKENANIHVGKKRINPKGDYHSVTIN